VPDEEQPPVIPNSGWRDLAGRFSTAFLTPKPPRKKAEPTVPSDVQTKRAVLNLDPRERKIGLIGSALAGAIALVTTLPYVVNPKMKVHAPAKGHVCPVGFAYDRLTKDCLGAYPRSHWVFEFALLAALALALFVTVRIGRRGAVGFTALLIGLAFESVASLLLGIPFIAGGGWLLIRAWRVQRYGSPTASKTGPPGEKRPAPVSTERPTRAKRTKANQPAGPVANKRYTPKAPKRRRPAPTPPGS
jgi:hypothetical protein